MVNSLGAGRSLLFVVIGFVLGLTLIAVPYMDSKGVFDPIPYRVTSSQWEREGSYIKYRATFVKDQCTFNRMVVRGVYFDHLDPAPLRWRDIHGEQGDRLGGEHTIVLLIGPLHTDYEQIEIRTRHICDGRNVDRVFDRIDLQ